MAFVFLRALYFSVAALVEFLICKFRKIDAYDLKEIKSNLLVFVLYIAFNAYFSEELSGLTFGLWKHRLIHFPTYAWWVYLLSFVLVDFAYYWMHRYNHTFALGWSAHFIHHSPTKMNLTVGTRLAFTRILTFTWLFNLPIVFLGIHPRMVAFSYMLNFFYQVLTHTEVVGRLGILEKFLVTPSHHRVHHNSDPQFFNSNFAGVFIIFDKIFGTFRDESEVQSKSYGFSRYMEKNYFQQFFYIWGLMINFFLKEKNILKKFTVFFLRPDKIKTS